MNLVKNELVDLISLANEKLKIITTEKDHHRIKHLIWIILIF